MMTTTLTGKRSIIPMVKRSIMTTTTTMQIVGAYSYDTHTTSHSYVQCIGL